MKYLMKCGHTANANTADGKPYCVICGCEDVAIMKYDLKDRTAKCIMCGKETQSNDSLPFFKFKPNHDYDDYYCGCGGWD